MLGRKSLLMVAQNILTGIIGYIGLFFILRYSGLETYGILQFSLSYLGLFSFILDFGFSTAHIKKISEGFDPWKGISVYFIVKLILIIIFTTVSLSSLIFVKMITGRNLSSPYEYYTIILILFYYIMQSLVLFYQATFNALSKAAIISIPRIIEATFRNVLYILTSYFIARTLVNKEEFSMTLAFILVLSYILYVLLYSIYARDWKFVRPEKEDFKTYIRFAIPVSITSIFYIIATYSSNLILQYYWGPIFLGAYISITNIIMFINSITISLSSFILPNLSSSYKNNDINKYSWLMQEFEKFLSITILPFVIFFIIFSDQILNLWTSSLIPFSMVLVILGINAYVNAINIPYSTHFNAIDKPKNSMYIQIFSSLFLIFLDIITIPKSIFGIKMLGLGATGLALSIFISTTANSLLFRTYVSRYIKSYVNNVVIKQIISGILTGFIMYSIIFFKLPSKNWYYLVSYFILTYLIFIIISYLLKGINKNDIKYIIDSFNIRDMLKYIKDELRRI
ncbi:MAG: oligosaccharide flippase family protein [Thermoplasmata archaeon]